MTLKRQKTGVLLETLEEELATKQAEYEQAKEQLEQLKKEAEKPPVYWKGIVQTPEEIERRAESLRTRKEQEKLKEKTPEKPFIPNPYILQREKQELADMMLHRIFWSEHKTFIDSRHKLLYDVYRMELAERRSHNLASFIEVLEKGNNIERAGGLDFVIDIFQGLPG